MSLPLAIAEFVLKQGGPVIVSLDPTTGEVVYTQEKQHRSAEIDAACVEPANQFSAERPNK